MLSMLSIWYQFWSFVSKYQNCDFAITNYFTCKIYGPRYLRTFGKLIHDSERNQLFRSFRRAFNIKDAAYIIGKVWNEVKIRCMNRAEEYLCWSCGWYWFWNFWKDSWEAEVFGIQQENIKEGPESPIQSLINEELAKLNRQAYDEETMEDEDTSSTKENNNYNS